MFRTILVPVDGSPFAEHALPWALALAADGGTVHLVHVHVPAPPLLVEGVVVADPTFDQTLREQEADYLGTLAGRVRAAAPGLTVQARNIDSDDPLADALARATVEAGADLVVMATHGRGAFARFWLGSTTDEFLRRSPVPVLLQRADDSPVNVAARARVVRFIVSLDGSELAGKIVEPALAVGKAFGAEFTLLMVLDAAAGGPPGSLDPTTPAQRAEQYLDRVARTFAERQAVAHPAVVREGPAAAAILELAGRSPSVGVALATHGRSGLSRLLAGSVADEVIRGAAGPVLVYHPPG